MQVTVKQFAAAQNIPPGTASVVLGWLKSKGQATIVGHTELAPNAKGKAANIYEVPDSVTVKLS